MSKLRMDHVTMYLVIAAAVGFLLWILTLCIICCICCCKCKTSFHNKRKQNKREGIKQGPPTAPPPGEAPRPKGTGPTPNNEPVDSGKATQSLHGPGSLNLNGTTRTIMYDDPPTSRSRDDEVSIKVDKVKSFCLGDDLYDNDRSQNNRLASYLEKGRSSSIAVDSLSLSPFKSTQNDIKPSHRTISDQDLEIKGVPVFPEAGIQKSFISSKENNDSKVSTVANAPENLYDIVDVPVP
ncbi:hypothetical protein HOLleu_13205 [Holothuria leucospilota]|uniref:Uncharacterized protein n=1 Tax=Holothuria leucospilota TaxID=206669 RepID=A0A9Q1CC59_HOLLE|nr:hypothetical protein HOLleu_13205 [Holothuria leucospilota]